MHITTSVRNDKGVIYSDSAVQSTGVLRMDKIDEGNA